MPVLMLSHVGMSLGQRGMRVSSRRLPPFKGACHQREWPCSYHHQQTLRHKLPPRTRPYADGLQANLANFRSQMEGLRGLVSTIQKVCVYIRVLSVLHTQHRRSWLLAHTHTSKHTHTQTRTPHTRTHTHTHTHTHTRTQRYPQQ